MSVVAGVTVQSMPFSIAGAKMCPPSFIRLKHVDIARKKHWKSRLAKAVLFGIHHGANSFEIASSRLYQRHLQTLSCCCCRGCIIGRSGHIVSSSTSRALAYLGGGEVRSVNRAGEHTSDAAT